MTASLARKGVFYLGLYGVDQFFMQRRSVDSAGEFEAEHCPEPLEPQVATCSPRAVHRQKQK